jgi:hypothetical protein
MTELSHLSKKFTVICFSYKVSSLNKLVLKFIMHALLACLYFEIYVPFSSWELCDILSGSHYNNVHHCPMEVVASSPDINCACPFTPGTYHVNPTHFVIDGLPQAVKFLAQVRLKYN